ncbi:Flp pilus assembly complex ATPase component TadA [Candidatus Micrarchaeota archaeon]|nr:Flp pilus assembly complex ATPase component TadA [Candidatus Micrarchaeota archaeon]
MAVNSLEWSEKACVDCNSCLKACPKNVKDDKIFNCTHCPPELAECKSSCRKGAIKEANGFLFVDENICNGCFECKCQKSALVFRDGKITKCDYCFGKPACASACPENALRASSDVKHAGSLLGWTVEKTADYFAPVPRLSTDEERVLSACIDEFKEVSKSAELGDRAQASELLHAILKDYFHENGFYADEKQLNYLRDVAVMSVCGFGVLDCLLKDDELEEISVCGLGERVRVFHRAKGWLDTNVRISSEEFFLNSVNKMARVLGRRITLQTPRLNAVLPDGSRLHASIPPLSNFELTIRKFRAQPISIPDLIRFNTLSSHALAFLWLAMQSDASILISGNTASGKTSTLNALFSFVPLSERIVITEETPEINVPHEHKVRMVANEELGIRLTDLVGDCLRMRPDRVIVAEVRTSDEAKALVETILSGQAKGSYATFHASTASETLQRLRSLGVLEMDLASLDLAVVQRRITKYDAKTKQSKEIRRVTEISEIIPSASSLPKQNTLFTYNPKTDSLERTSSSSFFLERIAPELGLSKQELERELLERKKFLDKLAAGKKTSFLESVKLIQKHSFA